MKWRELRERCKRDSDYIITMFFTNELSLLLTWGLMRTSVTPNQVTVGAMFCALISGVCYVFGQWIFGSLFLFFSHLLDCTDGNLARATGAFSPTGKWLDIIGDRLRETLVFLGVMFFFVRSKEPHFWVIFCALDVVLLLLYYYAVDLGLSLGIRPRRQDLTALRFRGVQVKWGVFEPVIYGFIVFSFVGLVKVQIGLVFVLLMVASLYQAYRHLRLREGAGNRSSDS